MGGNNDERLEARSGYKRQLNFLLQVTSARLLAFTSGLLRNPGVLFDSKLGFVTVEQEMGTNSTTYMEQAQRKRHRIPQIVTILRKDVLGYSRAGCTVVLQRKYPDPICLDQPAWEGAQSWAMQPGLQPCWHDK